MRCILVELNESVLPEMPREMGDYAARRLVRRGFEVLTGTAIREVTVDAVVVGEEGRRIATRTVIWTSGVKPSPVVGDAGVEVDRAGRAVTAATMATSREGVYAIGDCASIPNLDDPAGRPHAPTAQNAIREAKQLAANIVARIDGGEARPFRYRIIGVARYSRTDGAGADGAGRFAEPLSSWGHVT